MSRRVRRHTMDEVFPEALDQILAGIPEGSPVRHHLLNAFQDLRTIAPLTRAVIGLEQAVRRSDEACCEHGFVNPFIARHNDDDLDHAKKNVELLHLAYLVGHSLIVRIERELLDAEERPEPATPAVIPIADDLKAASDAIDSAFAEANPVPDPDAEPTPPEDPGFELPPPPAEAVPEAIEPAASSAEADPIADPDPIAEPEVVEMISEGSPVAPDASAPTRARAKKKP